MLEDKKKKKEKIYLLESGTETGQFLGDMPEDLPAKYVVMFYMDISCK